jgi:hypothetical protein
VGQHEVAEVALQLSGCAAHEAAVGALHGLQHGRGFGESQAGQVAPTRPVLQGALDCGFREALVCELGGQGARHSLLEEHVEDWGGLCGLFLAVSGLLVRRHGGAESGGKCLSGRGFRGFCSHVWVS